MAADTRCNHVVVLDVRGLSPVTDYYVLATGTSARQMKSAADAVSELGETMNFPTHTRAGEPGSNWIAMDFIDVVLHVFDPEARQFYDLDTLWGDAKRVDWQSTAKVVG